MAENFRLRDLKIGARDMFTLDPSNIQVEQSFNPRDYRLPENRAHLDELKRSIAANGVQVPLLVRIEQENRAVVLVDGECRLRAVNELRAEGVEIAGIPVIQVPGGNEPARLVLALTANTGKPLSKWEMGGAFRRLANFGWSTEQIVTKTGYAQRFVEEAIELSDAPEEIKYLLSEQAVTPSLALSEIRKSGSGASLILRQRVEEQRSKGAKGPVKRGKAPTVSNKTILGELGEISVELAQEILSDHSDWEAMMKLSRKILKLAKTAGVPIPEKVAE